MHDASDVTSEYPTEYDCLVVETAVEGPDVVIAECAAWSASCNEHKCC